MAPGTHYWLGLFVLVNFVDPSLAASHHGPRHPIMAHGIPGNSAAPSLAESSLQVLDDELHGPRDKADQIYDHHGWGHRLPTGWSDQSGA